MINEASQDGSTIDSENLAEIEKTINDFLYAYDGKNYYQVYSFKDNVNASLSEALSVNALNDISDYVASGTGTIIFQYSLSISLYSGEPAWIAGFVFKSFLE